VQSTLDKIVMLLGHFGNDKSSHTKQHCFLKNLRTTNLVVIFLIFSFFTHLCTFAKNKKTCQVKTLFKNIFELRTFSMTFFLNHTLPHLHHVPNLSIVKVFVHVK
jgi:hypothetical protein